MNIAIIGDIHGNKDALVAMLSEAKKLKVQLILITGDIVGYYPFVKEVLELLKNWNTVIVKGNHEEILKNSLADQSFLEQTTIKYGSGLEESIRELSNDEIKFLTNLPHPMELEIEQKNILLAHGSPVDVNEYIYPDCEISKLAWLENIECDILICGHTHYPMKKFHKNKIILNPGSIGQPRNKGSGANWILYDTLNDTFTFKVTKYDISNVVKWAKKK